MKESPARARGIPSFLFFPFFSPFFKEKSLGLFPVSSDRYFNLPFSLFPYFPEKNKNRFLPLERKREKWYTMSYNLGPTEKTAANKETEKKK